MTRSVSSYYSRRSGKCEKKQISIPGGGAPDFMGFPERVRRLNERDKEWLLGLNLDRINGILLGLYFLFVTLSILDVSSTLVAMRLFPASFFEMNRLAASLFGTNTFLGFLLATIVLKVIPIGVILYPVLLGRNPSEASSYQVRAVKIAAIVALVAANLIYGYVVLFQNIPILMNQTL
jgi:hypothetical protein